MLSPMQNSQSSLRSHRPGSKDAAAFHGVCVQEIVEELRSPGKAMGKPRTQLPSREEQGPAGLIDLL